jgi:hypothetical protein
MTITTTPDKLVDEPDKLIDEYGEWIKAHSSDKAVGQWREITLPLLDNSNDQIGFYAKTDGKGISITDDGYTLEAFDSKGISLTPVRRRHIDAIVRRFGAQLDSNDNIVLNAESNRPDALNQYVQAIVDVQSLLEMTPARIHALFRDDVADFLDSHNIEYTPDIDIRGISGLYSSFDFLFQKTPSHPTRFCKAPNNFDLDSFRRITWTWQDTRRDPKRRDSRLIVIGNDLDRPLNSDVVDAYSRYAEYGIQAIGLSELENNLGLVS